MPVEAKRDHAVLRAIQERIRAGSTPTDRTDGQRIVLSIEGGGNRGVIAGGMAEALDEAGLLPAFDAVYGSSAGALTGAWLLSGHIDAGLVAWTDPPSYARATRRTNVLHGRPAYDVEWLIETYYDQTLGLDADAILANPISFHPLATDAATGASCDLGPLVHDRTSLHLAMRASSGLPILAGRPLAFGGRRFLDAGLAESIPLDTPIAAGATHVLALATRPHGSLSSDSRAVQWITDRWMRRHAPGAREAFLQRNARAGEVAARLEQYALDGSTAPAVLTVRPAADTPHVGRGETDPAAMRAGAAAGLDAMRQVIAHLA